MTASCVDGVIVNDETVEALVKMALAQAEAGRRHPRPVRHDGRPHRRDPHALEAAGTRTWRSCPTRRNTPRPSTGRSATRSGASGALKGDKKTYQMTPPTDEALR
jgi:porphobilinogen synthase